MTNDKTCLQCIIFCEKYKNAIAENTDTSLLSIGCTNFNSGDKDVIF